jgi:cobalt-zinc-cadmium efflux system outer membrane protein
VRAQWVRLGAVSVLAAGLAASVPSSADAQADAGPLGATLQGMLAAGRQLSPALRAAALDTAAASAKAGGAAALDDPTVSDSYQYYRDPGVFSGHSVTVTQAFPLWGKRSLRREAALADVDAARGREKAARNELDEKIKVAFAQYDVLSRSIAVNREVQELAHRMRAASVARYGQGGGDQAAVIQVLGEETTAKLEIIRLEGERAAARARLNALVARPADAPLAAPRPPPLPTTAGLTLAALLGRARAGNPTMSAQAAEIAAARTRRTLADKAWYPDITVGAGPLIQTNNRPVGFAATVGLNIPVPWGRTASGQQEAAARLSATQQRYDATLLEVEGALGEGIARLEAARRTEALLRREALPQAQGAFRAVLASYGQGQGDLTAAIAAEHRIHDVQLTLLRTELAAQTELAGIERLVGGDL